MIGFGSKPHYRHHLEQLGLEIVSRRPIGHSHVVVASRRDARVLEAVQGTQVAVVEHGAGQRYHIDAGGPETPHPNVTLFLAPSERVVHQSAHLFPFAELQVCGSPRVEHLSALPRRPQDIALAFHWNSPIAPESMSAWQHYRGVLPSLTEYPIIGHGHPAIRSKLKPWYKRNRIEWVEDWAEVVQRAKLLVIDNSSIMWEACALDIPVVVLNAPWYRRNVDFGLRFWSHHKIGPVVNNPGELARAIKLILSYDRWSKARKRAADYVYQQPLHGASRAAITTLDRWVVSTS
ncbi:MAG: hypothetical protein GY906_10040 [bacterium]|nr:hypothetical protein [bacterium]